MCIYSCGDPVPNCSLPAFGEHYELSCPCVAHVGDAGSKHSIADIKSLTLDFLRDLHELDASDEAAAEAQVKATAHYQSNLKPFDPSALPKQARRLFKPLIKQREPKQEQQ